MDRHTSVLCVGQRATQIYQVSVFIGFIYVSYLNILKSSGHYMYRQFNIQQFCFLPHSVFMCFVWILEQTAIISLYKIN